jgi:DNA ligase D-like protein (predicted polymerase)
MPARKQEVLEVAGREVIITNPDKVFFPDAAGGPLTKLDVVGYYLAVADGALRGVRGRPMALKRYPNGADGEFFFQKRAPESRPDWIETVELAFPSGRTAWEIVVRDDAQLAWVLNLGCIDLNPHPVRAEDLDHPDELRVDLDPVPGVPWRQIVDVALVSRQALADFGLQGWPKTSGSRGIHVYCRVEPRWTFTEVRRAAVALAREVERRAPSIATAAWWKEERHGVFLDYNQNAKDRTVASAYSVRPLPDARVSAPLRWDEVETCDPATFTVATVPSRFAEIGDPAAGMDGSSGSLDGLLELAAEHEAAGLADAPWPPQFPKGEREPPRVQPSRRRTTMPLVEVARAATQAEALEGLERWKSKHQEVVPHLKPPDVLVDAMRGRSTTWTRIRVNLKNVPEELRPSQEPLEVDYDPWAGVEWPDRRPKAD